MSLILPKKNTISIKSTVFSIKRYYKGKENPVRTSKGRPPSYILTTALGHRCDPRPRQAQRDRTHVGDEAAGADGVVEAHPLLVVGVVAAPQEVLGAQVVGLLVDHPATAVHTHRIAAAQVRLQVGVVAAALIVAALEAPVLVEGDLQGREGEAQRPGLQPFVPECFCLLISREKGKSGEEGGKEKPRKPVVPGEIYRCILRR